MAMVEGDGCLLDLCAQSTGIVGDRRWRETAPRSTKPQHHGHREWAPASRYLPARAAEGAATPARPFPFDTWATHHITALKHWTPSGPGAIMMRPTY